MTYEVFEYLLALSVWPDYEIDPYDSALSTTPEDMIWCHSVEHSSWFLGYIAPREGDVSIDENVWAKTVSMNKSKSITLGGMTIRKSLIDAFRDTGSGIEVFTKGIWIENKIISSGIRNNLTNVLKKELGG